MMAGTEIDLGRGVSSHGGVILLLLLPVAWTTLSLSFGWSAWSFIDYVNLPFHEAGHLFFSPFGSTLYILGGTLGELIVPALLGAYFILKDRRPAGAAFCLWWFGENFVYIARYMADARDLDLPLVGGGDHDWNELFYRFGLLSEPSVARIASLTHLLGVVLMILGLAWLGFFALPRRRREAIREELTTRWPVVAFLLDE
jgi:hypothetical protein